MSWPWLVVLVLAAALVVAVETPRLGRRFGADARRERERARRKKSFRVVTPVDEESDEFIKSPARSGRASDDRGARPKTIPLGARPESASADSGRAKIPEGVGFAAAADLAHGESGGERSRVREDAENVLGVLRLLVVRDTQAQAVPPGREARGADADHSFAEGRGRAVAVSVASIELG